MLWFIRMKKKNAVYGLWYGYGDNNDEHITLAKTVTSKSISFN